MSLTTILLMVLGVAIIVFIIWGFSNQWQVFRGVVDPFTSASNVEQVKQVCSLACSSGSVTGFCNDPKTMKFGKKITVDGDEVKQVVGTCDELTQGEGDLNVYAVDKCPSITCPPVA